MTSKQVSRRSFLQYSGLTGTAFFLGFSSLSGKAGTQQLATGTVDEPAKFTPFIRIDSGGTITIFNNKPEIGQGTFQSIPALIAEELDVPLELVTIALTNGENEYGGQFAGGSSSVRSSYIQMRKVGASAREMLVKAASIRWGVEMADCRTENGLVIHPATKRTVSYGELAAEAAKLDVPKEPKLKDPNDFIILNKVTRRPDVPLKTCGKAEFGIDVDLPGMVYATVERCPVIGGTLKRFSAEEALKLPGVLNVVEVERVIGKYKSVGVAVIANSYWTALQGRKKLAIEWDTKGFETFDSAIYEDKLRSLAKEEGILDKKKGEVENLSLPAQNTLEAFYETPMVAHHPLEPMNCVAHVAGEKLTIWTSTQVPSSIKNMVPGAVGFKPENVKVHCPFVGGGFGRRLDTDYVKEAILIAKHVDKPVKVIWTREDTTEQGPFRPMTFSQLKGGLSADGKLISFQHKVISPSYGESNSFQYDKSKVDNIMVEGIGEQAYEIPNVKTSFVRADYHVPLAWRSVTSSTVAFAHECFIDELAHKAKIDPLAFRLAMLEKPSDVKRVLLKLKEVSNWDKRLPKGKGRGIAQWQFFAGLCAQVVEVSLLPDKTVTIEKVIAVIDLGEVVNPDNVRNQVEGAIVMGIGAAIKPGITLAKGRVMQHNFYDSPLMRINEIPQIEVHILAEGGTIKGVGEPGLPALAPALANAIFDATGKRFRKMPFDLAIG